MRCNYVSDLAKCIFGFVNKIRVKLNLSFRERSLGMIPVNFVLVCLISQGAKGVYPTYVLANFADESRYYTISRSKADKHPVNKPGLPISKKSCKVVYDYNLKQVGKEFNAGGKDAGE